MAQVSLTPGVDERAVLVDSTGAALGTPTVFKTAQATALGSTALWTPTAGKKFRLMRFMIAVTENATLASGAVDTIKLLDAAADIGMDFDVFIPTTAFTSSGVLYSTGWIDLGNGILSAVANNILNVDLAVALATGSVRVIACGTEE